MYFLLSKVLAVQLYCPNSEKRSNGKLLDDKLLWTPQCRYSQLHGVPNIFIFTIITKNTIDYGPEYFTIPDHMIVKLL